MLVYTTATVQSADTNFIIKNISVSKMKTVEFRLINSNEMPPIVITKGDDDELKVVINSHDRIWLSMNRRLIAGTVEALQEKLYEILQGYLEEQYAFEKADLDFMEG